MLTGIPRSLIILFILVSVCGGDALGQPQTPRDERFSQRAMRRLADAGKLVEGWQHTGDIRIDSVEADAANNILLIWFSNAVTHIPVRYPWLLSLEAQLKELLGFRFRNYELELFAGGRSLTEFIPNYYREDFIDKDDSRAARQQPQRQLVKRAGRHDFEHGLSGSHIALWPSHGYYYEAERDRWEWQRARLFGIIEDLYPFSFIQPYLLPMLENSGAYVMLPRERDIQSYEVIVDNDGSTGESELLLSGGEMSHWEIKGNMGFAISDTLFEGDNPFRMGTYLQIKAEENPGAFATYIPDIPEDGDYAVYVSWAASEENISGVSYTVHHGGGATGFLVDQTMGHGTWIYLGTFRFFRGSDTGTGSVVVCGSSSHRGYITTDAVRFGGGTGNVARRASGEYLQRKWSLHDGNSDDDQLPVSGYQNEAGWKLSSRPRYIEGARYYLQYSGMPDSTVYSINHGRNDYNDDFMSRGEWVNYLLGAPMTVTGKPDPGSPLIPIDLALAFHTDAGVTPDDSVIGTLAIYSSERSGGFYHSGQSRMASRDLSDIIQTQIVSDLRLGVNHNWTRRGLWDRQYSEAWRPQVPAMLLELLSHQNLADLSYGLDPRFKFTVSRSIYKGILRYLAFEQGRDAVIQPLPPVHMALEKRGTNSVRLSWKQQEDPLEPDAVADSYMVYSRVEDGGFDNGIPVSETHLDIDLPEKGTIYSFRVTALNSGGESLPGEVLSVSLLGDESMPVLVVNGFTRISGPAVFDQGDMAGIAWWDDQGVADRIDLSRTGDQYDFSRTSEWLDDDSPGWGASYADMEGKVIPGNSFDFPVIYGRSLRGAGYSFISAGRDAFEDGRYDPDQFAALVVAFGEQRGTIRWDEPSVKDFRVFTPGMMDAIYSFARPGGNIFLSGAYIGTDMVENNDSIAIEFAGNVLGFLWRTNHACNSGKVKYTGQVQQVFPEVIEFNNTFNPGIYTVEAPDGIEPADGNSTGIYRYGSTKTSAGIIKSGVHRVIALGFPFESVTGEDARLELMKRVMEFFDGDF